MAGGSKRPSRKTAAKSRRRADQEGPPYPLSSYQIQVVGLRRELDGRYAVASENARLSRSVRRSLCFVRSAAVTRILYRPHLLS